MIDDHTRTNQELAGIAAPKGMQPPTTPSADQRAKIQQLNAASGQAFDRLYVDLMGVQAHQDTVRLFEQMSRDATDVDIKAFATKTLPALRHHLQMAQQLRTVIAG
jgi:putative membrane protein